MSDAAFREALDAYISLVQWLRAWALNRDNTRTSEEEINAARARVLALYAGRQGHEHTVGFLEWKAPDGESVRLNHIFTPEFSPGDRVWVTKVEEGQ